MKLFLIPIFCFIVSMASSQNKAFIATEHAKEDIEYMIKTIEAVHYNPYFMVSKEQFNASKEEIIKSFDQDSIPFTRFLAAGMKLAAQLSGGHTAMDWQNAAVMPELATYQFLPFSGKIMGNNQLLVVTKSSLPQIKVGTQIKSINGVSIVDLYRECLSYLGGIASFKDAACEKALPLFLFFTEKISAPYSIELGESNLKLETEGIDISELISLLNQDQPKENYTFEFMEDNIGFLSYNSCTDYAVFETFLENTFEALRKGNTTKLIIDIRENSGGNSSLNDVLLSYITEKPYQQSSGRFWKVSEHSKMAYKENSYENIFGEEFMNTYYALENNTVIEPQQEELTQPEKPKNYFKGKTCFLIGPNTFSSANFLADAIKTYDLSTLIGLPTGENTNDFGELISFVLPNSSSSIYVSSTYDIGANGDPTLFEPVYPGIEVKDSLLQFTIDWINK